MPSNAEDTEQLRVRSPAHLTKYVELVREKESLSLYEFAKWTADLDEQLKGNGNVEDFFEWMKESLEPHRPDYSSTTPEQFRRLLLQANWRNDDSASQIVTGRLWYGNSSQHPDAYIGRYKDCVLGLRLKANFFSPQETDAALCVLLEVETLLPHIFLAMQYSSTSSEEESLAPTSMLLLGMLLAHND